MTPSPNHSDQPESSRSIWVFTPSRTPPEDLEAIFVQRHELLKDAVERVRESALTDHKHHLLFVGQRGCGKTHLVTLIVSRISADAEAAAALRLAWLNEDETCTSLLELLLKIHAALEKRYPTEFRTEDLAGAYELKAAAAQDFVAQRLLEGLGSKTLVIVTENLDALFDSMGREGQKQLRAFIQENPRIAIVATAQRLVEDLSDRASPFFGFFQTEHLKTLTVEQATDLLQNIARIQGKDEVIAFLATGRGRSRVRALHHLSGGNHRIYIVLSQFITRESMDALVGPFLKMVDELTPYYQERVRWLPPLQRKIVELLCTCEGTVPVKEIARRLFSTPQTISSQLQDLREKGYVESSQRGRESLYEISEPLMRICVEVKENQNNQPLRLLVDFLRVWYDDGELKRRLGLALPTSPSYFYLKSALERNNTEGNLRIKLLAQDVLGLEFSGLAPDNLKRLEAEIPEDLFIAMQRRAEGDGPSAIRYLDDVLNEPEKPSAQVTLWLFRGILHREQGNTSAAMADLSRVIELTGAPPAQVAMALFNRGCANGQQGQTLAEIADYTRVIESKAAPAIYVARALINRGFTYAEKGDTLMGIADYTRAIELPGAPAKYVARALLNRGVTLAKQGEGSAAIADFSRILGLAGAPSEEMANAYFNRGIVHDEEGRASEAVADYTRVIEMPNAPPEQVAKALIRRGVTHDQRGNASAAIADYTRVIELHSAQQVPLTNVFICRGFAHAQQGDSTAAIADFSNVVELPDASPEDVIDAHHTLALLHFTEGQWNEGLAALESGVSLGTQHSPPRLEAPVDIIGVFFAAGLSPEGRCAHAGSIYSLYAKHAAEALLGEALVKDLGAVFRAGAPWPSADNLDQWLAAWQRAAGDAPEFKLPLRLLRTGIEFVKSGGKEEGILLDLTSPERSILRQALGLSH